MPATPISIASPLTVFITLLLPEVSTPGPKILPPVEIPAWPSTLKAVPEKLPLTTALPKDLGLGLEDVPGLTSKLLNSKLPPTDSDIKFNP